MKDLIRQNLALSFGKQSDSLTVLMADFETEQFAKILPENSTVTVLPNSPSYLPKMAQFIETKQPNHLLLIPPYFGGKELPPSLRQKYPRLGLHEIALQIAIEHLSDNGTLGILLPQSFLTSHSCNALRNQIADEDYCRLLIGFDFGFDQVVPVFHRSLKFHLVIVSKQGSLVRFFHCPEMPAQVDGAGERHPNEKRQNAILKDLRKLKKQGGGPTEFGFVLRENLLPDVPWIYERYHPSYASHLADLAHFGSVQPLGDLVDMQFGFRPAEKVNLLMARGSGREGIPVLEARDIVTYQIDAEQTRYLALPEKSEPYLLQANDICVNSILNAQSELHGVLIEDGMLPLLAEQSVLILRPKAELDLDVAFLAAYLQSDFVVKTLQAQGMALRLYPRALADLPVPVYDEDFRVALQALREASEAMGTWQDEATIAIDSLFEFESAKDARTHILAAGRRVRQRHFVAKQVDDLSYRLRSGLPHPLAYRWRLAETAQPSLEGYLDVLECAETAVCFLALLSLVMMQAVNESVKYLEPMADRLTNIGHGTNFGDWVSILREVQGRKPLKRMGNVPFYEVARFLDDDAVDEALSVLNENRNDNSHGRGPKGSEIAEKLDESLIALQSLLATTEFLTEYPLRYIEETRYDSITGITTYTFRALMGDHAIVGLEEAETEQDHLEKGSLYLVDRDGKMYLIRPYMIRQECPVCHREEIFFLDKYEKKSDICHLKSMKFGHAMIDTKMRSTFSHVGLILDTK